MTEIYIFIQLKIFLKIMFNVEQTPLYTDPDPGDEHVAKLNIKFGKKCKYMYLFLMFISFVLKKYFYRKKNFLNVSHYYSKCKSSLLYMLENIDQYVHSLSNVCFI